MTDILGKEMPVMDVFKLAIQFLVHGLFDKFDHRCRIDTDFLKCVVVVPSNWNEQIYGFLQEVIIFKVQN